MKILGKNSISNYIRICLQLVFIGGTLILITLPFLLNYYLQLFNLPTDIYPPTLTLLYVSGIPALIIIYQFIKLFESLKDANPFVTNNSNYLKTSSFCSLIIAIEYFISIFIFKSVFTIIIMMIFIIAWIGLYILSELFKQAINYKEENDLTI